MIVAPVIVVGALLFMRPDRGADRRRALDWPGALLVAGGSFSLVFGLSEGATYGWWAPVKDLTVASRSVWPASRAVSIIPFAFLVALTLFTTFVVVERRKEREARDPLFEFGQLRHLGFRYGLLTTMVLAMGQFGLLFVLPVLLQDGKHLSAWRTGLWLIPQGAVMAVAAPIGGRLANRFSITGIVRAGLALEAVGLGICAIAASEDVTFLSLLPGLVLFGIGVGFASSQLTNVIMSDVDPDKTGVAAGTNTTVRQVGLALGIAVFASFLHVLTIRNAASSLRSAPLPEPVKSAALSAVHAQGVNFAPPAGTAAHDASTLQHIAESAVAAGARPALLFASAVVALGTALSFLIPRVTVARQGIAETTVEALTSEMV